MFASPAESFSSSSASLQDYGIPAAEVSFDSIPAELPIHYNFYGAVASPAADAPSDLDSPAAAGAQGAVGKNKGGRAKRRRDPNRPKGWISAILMYSNAHRARVQLERPDATFGEIVSWTTLIVFFSCARYPLASSQPTRRFHRCPRTQARVLSAEYRALAPEDRAVWEQAHEDDKARYEREMLSYVPPPQISPSDGDESASGAEGAVQAKKPRKKRDPNAPKVRKDCRCHCFVWYLTMQSPT